MDNLASKKNGRKFLPAFLSVVIGLILTIIYIRADLQSIEDSTNSTAAIGYIFIPFIAIFYFICFGVFGYCIGVLLQAAISKDYRQKSYLRLFLAGLISVCSISAYTVDTLQTNAYREKVAQIYAATSSAQIDAVYSDMTRGSYHDYSFPILDYYQIYIMQALAQSKYTSTAILDKLAHSGNSRFAERIGGPKNGKGFSAARLICFNKNTSVASLIYIMEKVGEYTLQDGAYRAVEIKNWELANKINEICKNDDKFHCHSAKNTLKGMNAAPPRSRIINRTFEPIH